jgi:PAS domain S-box-containing protein
MVAQLRRTILIVDDSFTDRAIYRRYLSQEAKFAYTILEEDSGKAALERCQSCQLDGILLDFLLPDMDGLDFLAALQDQIGNACPPVVMLTGYGSEAIAVKAMKGGAEDYLSKQKLTPEELRLAVRSAIKNAKLRCELQHKNQELQDSHHLIQQIVNTTPGILYLYDLIEQRSVYVNHQITQLLGYTAAEVQAMGNNLLPRLFHPEDFARIPAYLEQLHSTPDGTTHEIEYRMQHANGEWRWFSGREVVFKRTPDGQLHQILGYALDITTRKQAELDLYCANERFELAAAAVNALIYDWDVPTGSVERTRGLEILIGYTPEEAGTALEWWGDRIHPDDFQRTNADFLAHRDTQDYFSNEYRVRHRDGHYIWVEDHCLVVRDASGEITRIVGSTRDISDRKQAEAALQQSEALFRGVFESDLIGILFWNTEGQITDANDTFLRMTGYSREDIQAGRLYHRNLTPPEYYALDEQKFEQLLTSGRFDPVEKEYICKDGSRLPILLGCAFLPGSRDRGVAFALDIREQKRLEQEHRQLLEREQAARAEAEAANRSKDDFLAMVSHELRSPLNSILGWAKLLRTRSFDQAATVRALETIERNARVQSQLIEDLLDISRMIQGTLRMAIAPINLVAVLDAALTMVRPMAEAKRIDCRLQVKDSGWQETSDTFAIQTTPQPEHHSHAATLNSRCIVSGDFDRLQQIVWNLLTNAIKFTPEGGQVTVSLERVIGHRSSVMGNGSSLIGEEPERPSQPPTPNSQLPTPNSHYAQLTVTDTGRGISPDFLPHVFGRFKQGKTTGSSGKDGLGLGLAIVQHLVHLHGGNISAASPGEGKGATFTILLPLLRSGDSYNSAAESGSQADPL